MQDIHLLSAYTLFIAAAPVASFKSPTNCAVVMLAPNLIAALTGRIPLTSTKFNQESTSIFMILDAIVYNSLELNRFLGSCATLN